MSTDEIINAEQDQAQIETTDHVEDSVEQDFNARKASKTLSEKLNKLESKYEQRIAELEARLKPEPETHSEEVQEEDIETKILKKTEELVAKKEWLNNHKSRIDNLSEESQEIFNQKLEAGLSQDDALKLAEANEPYKVTTKEQLHPRSASVNRESADVLSDTEKAEAKKLGISEKAYEIQKQRKEQRSRI